MAVVIWIRKLSDIAGYVGGVVVVPLALAMLYEVVSRYVFSAPTFWAFDVSYMMMGVIFLLGMSYALKEGAHVNVDLIHSRLPRPIATLIDLVTYAIVTWLNIWIVVALVRHVQDSMRTGEGSGVSAWNPTIWPFHALLVIGFLLLTLQTFAKCLEAVLGFLSSTKQESTRDL